MISAWPPIWRLEKTEVTVTPQKPGEYEFTCQMRMYRGVLVARNP